MLISIKECFNLKGKLVNLGLTNEFFKFNSPFDSEIVKLLKDKYNLESSSCTPFCVGVLDPTKDHNGLIMGASSSGSALDLVTDKIDLAVSTCTGGSTIVPSARINVYGFKPTYGRISRYGLVPLCSSLDTVGLMSKKLNLIREVYSCLDQWDPKDLRCLKERPPSEALNLVIAGNLFNEKDLNILVKKLPNVKVKTLELDEREIVGAYYYRVCPDFYSNMNRFDGFTHKNNQKSLKLIYDETKIKRLRSQELSEEIKSRIILGSLLLKNYSLRPILNFNKKYNARLGDYTWILPVAKNLRSPNLDQTPYPAIANLLHRPSLTIPSELEQGLVLIGPKNSDLELLDYGARLS